MKVNLITGLILFSIIAFAESDICKSYNSKEFVLEKTTYKKDKEIKEKIKIDNLKIYFFKDRGKDNPITVEYSVKQHKKYYRYVYCMEDDNKEWCGIECDGGGFYVNKNLDILIKHAIAVTRDEEGELPTLSIAQKNKEKYIKGKDFPCPKPLATVKSHFDKKYYKDNSKGKYVCYRYKDNQNYDGCFRSIKMCNVLNLEHFGKYISKKDVKEALKRCKNSKPKQDYIDNPKGNYVCYDHIDSDGEYSSCFRAIRSCEKLNKKNFGHYFSQQTSKEALTRCQISLPNDKP